MGRTNTRLVSEWLATLGPLVSGNANRAENEARLRAFIPLLVEEFPAEVFTPKSLTFVARRCKWFPTFGEVCAHLSDWHREQRPITATRPALEAPAPAIRTGPTEEEKAQVRATVDNLLREIAANRPQQQQRSTPKPVSDEMLLRMCEASGNFERAGQLRRKLGATA